MTTPRPLHPQAVGGRRPGDRPGSGAFLPALTLITLFLSTAPLAAQIPLGGNEPGIREPVLSTILGTDVRVPNTDQSVDGVELSNVVGDVVYEDATSGSVRSMLGHPITHVASPNRDLRVALGELADAADFGDTAGMQTAAAELRDILLGTTQGRIYDGFSMLNFNRFSEPSIPLSAYPPDVDPGEYKMKTVRDTGETFVSPFDGETRKIWEVDVNHLYYDGQIDADTFLIRFPVEVHPDDTLRVSYRIFSLVVEDFSPTLVMLDHRLNPSTVQFPFKGFDAVWIPFDPGQVLNVTVAYPPIRMIRGIYDWGWRVHPPRIQFIQPIYEIVNQHTGEAELDPQSESFAFRNREDLTIDTIADAAPEKKMYRVARAVLDGEDAATIDEWLTDEDEGPRGTWWQWADLAENQRQLPPEAWDLLAEEGLQPGNFGDYEMITVYANNEMYGTGPNLPEVAQWRQRNVFDVKLVNLDDHTHYFRNVDFSARLHDDILRCCGGGLTSFEIMNFKPTFGAPKVAEAQWRAGWGFRPHLDVLQQTDVFPRSDDRVGLEPYTGGDGRIHYGYRYSAETRGGDFRFNPPPFVIGSAEDPAPFPLEDTDGEPGLLIGQFTPGYGGAQMCPDDPYPGFCTTDINQYNPHDAKNFPPPPLQGQPVLPPDVGKFPGDVYPDHPVELRFPPFLRNPAQTRPGAGDIIPPTAGWRPFLWINPNNGSLFIDPDDPSKGHWADLTYSHGAPVFAGDMMTATVEAPRAGAQVFYQFDDLFHDNDIFSPHPVFKSFDFSDELDSIVQVGATVRNDTLRVKGVCSDLSTGERAGWVAIHDGPADETGCPGTRLGVTPVDAESGRFSYRLDDSGIAANATVCVQSVVGGSAETGVTGRSDSDLVAPLLRGSS